MKKLLVILGIAAVSAVAIGATDFTHSTSGLKTGLNNVAMNGAAGTRTFTISSEALRGRAIIQFWFDFTYASAAGTITLTCTGGPTSGNSGYTLSVCDPASATGQCLAADSGILTTASLSASKKWDGRLGVLGAGYLSCVAAHGGTPTASEKLSVYYQVLSQ